MNKEISEEDAESTAEALRTLAEIEKSMLEEERANRETKASPLQKDTTKASSSDALAKKNKEDFSDIAKELESINYVVNAGKEDDKKANDKGTSTEDISFVEKTDRVDLKGNASADGDVRFVNQNEKKYIDYRDKEEKKPEEKKSMLEKNIFKNDFKLKVTLFFTVLMGALSFILKIIFYTTFLSMLLTPLFIVFFWSLFVYTVLYLMERQTPELYELILNFFTRENSDSDDAKDVGGLNIDDEDLDRDALFGGNIPTASSDETGEYSKISNVEMQDTPSYEISKATGELLSDDPEGRYKDGKKVTTKDFDFSPNEIAKAVRTMMNKDKT